MLSGALTNTCSIRGKVARAWAPHADGSTGTSRQPAGSRPKSPSAASIAARAVSDDALSWLRNTVPAAKRLFSLKPSSSPIARRKDSGNLMSRPQPSPVLPSAATAPRCVRRASAAIAVSMTQWLGRSSRFAISPKPQLSRCSSGSSRFLFVFSAMRATRIARWRSSTEVVVH